MTTSPTRQAPPLESIAFDELGGSFRGELLLPTGPGYDTARRVWNGAIDRHPACIARCTGVADVVAALRFARDGRRVVDAGLREHENFMQNFLRLLGEAPLDAEVHFLAPVAAMPDARRRMAETARERIAQALEDKPGHENHA